MVNGTWLAAITAVEDEQVVIETKCRVHRIPWLIVEQARLKVEF